MVFFVVEGSAGSRNNLPALGKETYPLVFLALIGNALLLPPPCQTAAGTADCSLHPNCVWQDQTPPLGYAVRTALGGSLTDTSLGNLVWEIGRKDAAALEGKGSISKGLFPKW